MSGVGRGGRGALLLQALQQPIRRPGQAPADQQQQQQEKEKEKEEAGTQVEVSGFRGQVCGSVCREQRDIFTRESFN